MSYVKAKQQYQEAAADHREDEPPKLACRWCNAMTPVAALASYGARCFRCYEAYCNSAPEVPHWAANKNTDGPKGWARALKKREMLGERLSPAQKAMWRAALRFESDGGEA